MRDLQNPKLISCKGCLFLLCGILSSGLLLANSPTLYTAVLLSLAVWSFCRCYYFAFYVIQHYVDENFRFTGLIDFVRYCLRNTRRSR